MEERDKRCISAGYPAWHGGFLSSASGGHFRVVLGVPKWTHLGTRNGPVWGPEMIPFEDSELTHFGTDLGTENRHWDGNEFILGRSSEMR